MKKQLGIFFVIAIMALTGVTAGYSHWTDTLNIQADVQTGDVEIKWVTGSNYVTDPIGTADMNSLGLPSAFPAPEGKDVGYMTSSFSGDLETLFVTYHNAYPQYFGNAGGWVINTGTIPVKIQEVNVYYSTDLGTTWTKVGYLTSTGLVPASAFDGNFEVSYGDSFGLQLHNGDFAELSFQFRLTNDAAQDTTYMFKFEPVAYQWFETP